LIASVTSELQVAERFETVAAENSAMALEGSIAAALPNVGGVPSRSFQRRNFKLPGPLLRPVLVCDPAVRRKHRRQLRLVAAGRRRGPLGLGFGPGLRLRLLSLGDRSGVRVCLRA
jgi:hypothetical protein